MIISYTWNSISEIVAIKTKTQKIHFCLLNGMSMCSRKFTLESDLEIDKIYEYKTFLGILDDQNICKICKKDLLTKIEDGHKFYFHQEVNIL